MTMRASNLASTVAPYDIVRKMRASILVLGPLVARAGAVALLAPAHRVPPTAASARRSAV
jgi:UDP-N-acetylglucosamine 1-carboxyvinyltransferase